MLKCWTRNKYQFPITKPLFKVITLYILSFLPFVKGEDLGYLSLLTVGWGYPGIRVIMV